MKFLKTASLLFSSLILMNSACMTLNVNVNFPESAVQQATDDYVRDLYRAKEKGKTPAAIPTSKPAPKKVSLSLVSVAWAEPVFRVKSAKALDIRDKLAANLNEVLAQKRTGVLGETNDGKLEIRDPQNQKKLFLKKLQRLVDEENSARDELYEEVVHSNGLPAERLKNVRESFARSFQSESPAGTWIQDAEGNWTQK